MSTATKHSKTVTLSRADYDELVSYRSLVERVLPVCTAAAKGDLESRVTTPPHELPTIVEATNTINDMLDELDAFVRESAAALHAAAEQRFHRRFLVRGMRGAFRSGAEFINQSSAAMATQAKSLADSEAARVQERQGSDLLLLQNIVSVSMSTIEMSVGSANVIQATRDSHLSTATMAGAVEELAASIKDIEVSARSTADTSAKSQSLTTEGQRLVNDLNTHARSAETDFDSLVDKTRELQTSVTALAGVVEVISKIAEQTNLLALNATIEAARAGELGKGFAVVAGEVKSLSKQTRIATGTIHDQISSLNEAFASMNGTVGHARESVHTVAANVAALDGGFDEMSEGSRSINEQVTSLASILGQQREAVESLARNMSLLKASGDKGMSAAGRLEAQANANLVLVEDWRAEHAKRDVPNRDVYLAKADHLLWKKTVIDFANGAQTNPSKLKGPAECRLGQWLSQQPDSLKWKASLARPHAEVHEHGIAAARCFANHEPEQGFAHYAQLETASAEVVAQLDGLIKSFVEIRSK